MGRYKPHVRLEISGSSPRSSATAFSPDSRQLVAAVTRSHSRAGRRAVVAWDLSGPGRPELVAERGWKVGPDPAVTFAQDGALLLTHGTGYARWDPANDRYDPVEGREEPGFMRITSHIAADREGVAVASSRNIAYFRSDSEQWRVHGAHRDVDIHHVAIHPDGIRVFSSGADRRIRIWDTATGSCVDEIFLPPTNWGTTRFAISPDGQTLATAGRGYRAALRRGPGWEVTAELSGHVGNVLGFAFSPDGALLATAAKGPPNDSSGGPGALFLWDVVSGSLVAASSWRNGWAEGPSFSQDGRWVACGDFLTTGGVRMWRVPTARRRASLADEAAAVVAAAPDVRPTGVTEYAGVVAIWVNYDGGTPRGIGWYDHDVSESSPDEHLPVRTRLASLPTGTGFRAPAAEAAERLGVTRIGPVFLLYNRWFDHEPGPFDEGTFLGNFPFEWE